MKWFSAKDYLDLDLCDNFVEIIKDSEPTNTDNKLFDDRVIYPNGIMSLYTLNKMKQIGNHLIENIKNVYDVSSPLYVDTACFVVWPKGSSMHPHRDNQDTESYSTPWRSHAAVIYLNDDFSGGEFSLNELKVSVSPKKSQCILIEAGLLHEVKKVLEGTRYTLAYWFTKDKERGDYFAKILQDCIDKFSP